MMRESIARWLCPEMARDADKARFVLSLADDLSKWCYGHVPIASLCGQWIVDSAAIHFMSLDEFHSGGSAKHPTRERIDTFRERLKLLRAAA